VHVVWDQKECVNCAVRSEYLNIIRGKLTFQGLMHSWCYVFIANVLERNSTVL